MNSQFHISFPLIIFWFLQSQEGRQKALKRSDVMIMDTVVLEATCIPDLIGYPEVPTSLVKHPSRTVMIKEFKHNVTFRDIEEALAFCISNITGIFFGSSSSVAYVEFEVICFYWNKFPCFPLLSSSNDQSCSLTS